MNIGNMDFEKRNVWFSVVERVVIPEDEKRLRIKGDDII